MADKPKLDFSTLLAASAHDMKNSLSLVINTLDEMMLESTEPGKKSPLHRLRYEAYRVNNDLVQLLTLYKLEKKQYCLTIDQHCVRDFLEEQLLYFQQELEFNGIDARLACPEDLEWNFDEGLLGSVIKNVINNALRYTRKQLQIGARSMDGMLVLSVEDDGEGYPPTMLSRELAQETGIDHMSGSTGLGLYFSTVIAQVHSANGRDGFVAISNGGAIGGGCFSIHLPAR